MSFNLSEDHAVFLTRFFEDNYEPKPLNETEAMTLVDDLSREVVPLRPDIHRMSKSFQLVCQILVNLFQPNDESQSEEKGQGRPGTAEARWLWLPARALAAPLHGHPASGQG